LNPSAWPDGIVINDWYFKSADGNSFPQRHNRLPGSSWPINIRSSEGGVPASSSYDSASGHSNIASQLSGFMELSTENVNSAPTETASTSTDSVETVVEFMSGNLRSVKDKDKDMSGSAAISPGPSNSAGVSSFPDAQSSPVNFGGSVIGLFEDSVMIMDLSCIPDNFTNVANSCGTGVLETDSI
jgi:hypothetical protein